MLKTAKNKTSIFLIHLVSIQFQASLHELTVQQRKELMEKGPFNLVFHGIVPDWIEEEMDDDPDFQRDVLEQKIKAIVRDEVNHYTLIQG